MKIYESSLLMNFHEAIYFRRADEECDPSPADSSCRLSVNSVGTASHSIMSTTFLSSVKKRLILKNNMYSKIVMENAKNLGKN